MLRKFMAETNSSLADVWDKEDGTTKDLKEATNIAQKQLEKSVKDMRQAMKDKDSKGEEKHRKASQKIMIDVSKPIMREFQANLKAFLTAQKKELSNKYGMPVDVYDDGKPVLGIGTNSSPLATKAGFGFHLIVDQPDI